MNKFSITRFVSSPLGVVTELAAVVIATEFIIMSSIHFIFKPMLKQKIPDEFWNYSDPILLIILLVPSLYYLVMRPMKELQQQLIKQNIELEHSTAKLILNEEKARASLQKEMEARERMIQIEKLSSLGTMVGGVAHEINNPLMGILNYVEFARDKSTDPKSTEVLGEALHEIHRIKKLVRNMLVFLRAGSAHHDSCNVHDTIDRSLALLDGELKKNDIQLQIGLSKDLPQIMCGSGSLQQVMVNLILNARDAIEEQEVQIITILGRHENGEVILSVCDNGQGVRDEILQKIFDPFFTTKPVGKGTGLGLSVSRHLVEEVGGSLNYREMQQYGCCFQMTFKAVA